MASSAEGHHDRRDPPDGADLALDRDEHGGLAAVVLEELARVHPAAGTGGVQALGTDGGLQLAESALPPGQDVAAVEHLPAAPDVIAPDGSGVRVLLQLGRGGMAHFELAAGQVSRAVAHHHVNEIWYVVGGHGQMWRRQADRQKTIPLEPGTCVSIPAGTHFQFRSTGEGPLTAVAVTMPPWPGEDEAYEVPGAWPAELRT